MLIKHCPEIAELYITPRNLGFYECNGVEAVALGARVVQDTGQVGGKAFGILPDGQKVVVIFKKEGDRRPCYNLTLYYYSTGELGAVDLGYPPEWISIRILKCCLDRVSITATSSPASKMRYKIWE